jgi:hypothetical protein
MIKKIKPLPAERSRSLIKIEAVPERSRRASLYAHPNEVPELIRMTIPERIQRTFPERIRRTFPERSRRTVPEAEGINNNEKEIQNKTMTYPLYSKNIFPTKIRPNFSQTT